MIITIIIRQVNNISDQSERPVCMYVCMHVRKREDFPRRCC